MCAEKIDAQQRPVKRRNDYGNTQPQAKSKQLGNPDTTINGNANPYNYNNTSTNTGMAIDTTLPITVIKSSGNGLLDSTKMSLRNDGAVERNLVKNEPL